MGLKIVVILLAIFFVMRAFAFFRAHPESLSKDALLRGTWTMGLLALALIAVMALLVLWLKRAI